MEQIPDVIPTGVEWWQYVLAVVFVIVGFILAGFARRAALKLLSRAPGVTDAVADAIARFASYLVIFLGFGLGLAMIGANIQPVLAIVLIIVVIAALVLKGVSDNFAAGVLLQTSHPFSPGDELTVDAADGVLTGVVKELGSRTVIIETYDGLTVHVPNARLVDEAIVSSPAGGVRRGEVQIRISREPGETDALLAQVAEATASIAGVDAQPAPSVQALAISPERLTARVRFWHDASRAAAVSGAVVVGLTNAFETAGRRCTVTSAPGAAPLAPPDAV